MVFTNNTDFNINNENVEIVHSMLQIQQYIESEEECFVIGGAMIYNLLMPYVTKMYVTQIDEEFEGDTFFPKIDEEKWKIVERIPAKEESKVKYEFLTYERK